MLKDWNSKGVHTWVDKYIHSECFQFFTVLFFLIELASLRNYLSEMIKSIALTLAQEIREYSVPPSHAVTYWNQTENGRQILWQ